MYDVFIEKHQIRAFGLFPHLIDVYTGNPIGGNFKLSVAYVLNHSYLFCLFSDHVTWGGMGDSFYEVKKN